MKLEGKIDSNEGINNFQAHTGRLNKIPYFFEVSFQIPPFRIENDKGLTNVVMGEISIEQAVNETEIDNLFCLSCGPIPPNPAEMLHTESFEKTIRGLAHRFDRIIFDSPPVAAVSDAMILASMMDGIVLVIQAGKTTWPNALGARRRLDRTSPLARRVHAPAGDLEREVEGQWITKRSRQ